MIMFKIYQSLLSLIITVITGVTCDSSLGILIVIYTYNKGVKV